MLLTSKVMSQTQAAGKGTVILGPSDQGPCSYIISLDCFRLPTIKDRMWDNRT